MKGTTGAMLFLVVLGGLMFLLIEDKFKQSGVDSGAIAGADFAVSNPAQGQGGGPTDSNGWGIYASQIAELNRREAELAAREARVNADSQQVEQDHQELNRKDQELSLAQAALTSAQDRLAADQRALEADRARLEGDKEQYALAQQRLAEDQALLAKAQEDLAIERHKLDDDRKLLEIWTAELEKLARENEARRLALEDEASRLAKEWQRLNARQDQLFWAAVAVSFLAVVTIGLFMFAAGRLIADARSRRS